MSTVKSNPLKGLHDIFEYHLINIGCILNPSKPKEIKNAYSNLHPKLFLKHKITELEISEYEANPTVEDYLKHVLFQVEKRV